MKHNVVNFPCSSDAEDEAREWVIRIDGGPLSSVERSELQDWLAQDACHARLLDEHAVLWAASSHASFPVPKAESTPNRGNPRAGWWLAGSLATLALVFAAIVLGPGLRWNDDRSLIATHATAVGERRAVPLPDGSRMQLNASSTLRVAFTPERRRVLLDKGEGLFDVAKDRSRPFEVVVGDTIVRAVGTRFFVQRHQDGRVEVTVYEGVVEIRKPNEAVALVGTDTKEAEQASVPQPMQLGMRQTAVSTTDHVSVAVADPQTLERKLAWQRDRIVFDRTPLSEALEDVNRYSLRPIRLGNESLRSIQVSGSFSTQDTGVFLRSLELGFALRVQSDSEGWVLMPVKQP